jgi:hypothetical protein
MCRSRSVWLFSPFASFRTSNYHLGDPHCPDRTLSSTGLSDYPLCSGRCSRRLERWTRLAAWFQPRYQRSQTDLCLHRHHCSRSFVSWSGSVLGGRTTIRAARDHHSQTPLPLFGRISFHSPEGVTHPQTVRGSKKTLHRVMRSHLQFAKVVATPDKVGNTRRVRNRNVKPSRIHACPFKLLAGSCGSGGVR